MSKEVLLNGIITAYRAIIRDRYQYDTLKQNYELPKAVNKYTVSQIRNYFLDYVYPSTEKRQELNEAFEALDRFIKSPKKLLGLLKESARLIFTHGRHLPKILNAGIKALKSYRTASKFENNLVEAAILNEVHPPYNETKINNLIAKLSRKHIDDFIESTEALFEIIHDETLVKKIKQILSSLIKKMKNKSKSFTKEDIKGLEIGLEMLTKGEELFKQLSPKNQKLLIAFVADIERDNIDTIFTQTSK